MLSIALHAALLLILINLKFASSASGVVPIVKLSLRTVPDILASDRNADGEPGADEESVTETKPVDDTPDTSASVDTPVTEPVAEERPPEPPPVTEPVVEERPPEPPPVTEPVAEERSSERPPVTEPIAEESPSEAPPLTEPVAEERPPEPPPLTEPVTEVSPPEPPPVSAPVAENRPSESAAEPPETTPEAELAQSDVPQEPVLAESTPPTVRRAEIVTAENSSERRVTSGPSAAPLPVETVETVEMAEVQEKMLSKQLGKWERDLDEPEEFEEPRSWEFKGQEYTAEFTRMPASDSTGLDYVIIEISTVENGRRLSSQMRMKRLAFSSYAQFVDQWDPHVGLHDDVIDGRFHSNSEIFVNAARGVQPTFLGRVTTAYRSINTGSSMTFPNIGSTFGRFRRDEVFLGGLETGVRRIVMPRRYMEDAASAGIDPKRMRLFETDTRITFYADGSYSWSELESQAPEQQEVLADEPVYLVAERKAELHLKGIVNGNVLVYSPDNIVIDDDLVYASDPRVDEDADDFIGLVSDRSVEVAPPEITGPGDLEIDAAIYAKLRFAVSRYMTRDDATLTIYGSLTAGSITATEPRFATNIQYDARLEDLRPPSFPMTDHFEAEAWDGVWQVDALTDEEPVATTR